MKTVFTYGGSNPYLPTKDAMIELRQSEDEDARFILTYGCQITRGLTYAMACAALGQAILHHLSCEFIVTNSRINYDPLNHLLLFPNVAFGLTGE